MSVRAVHDCRNVDRLRTLYDQIETGFRSLEALGVKEKPYGVLLPTVLRKAIPADIRLEYSRKVIAQAWTRTQRRNDVPPGVPPALETFTDDALTRTRTSR
ncbi:unnamed protein product [Ixodes persulcatus]